MEALKYKKVLRLNLTKTFEKDSDIITSKNKFNFTNKRAIKKWLPYNFFAHDLP